MIYEVLSVSCLIISIILLILLLIEKSKTTGKFNEQQENFENRIEEIQETISKNQNDAAESLVNYSVAINKEIQEVAQTLSKAREELAKTMSDDIDGLKEQVDTPATTVEKMSKENEQLRKKLEFFTEIGEDSKQLNEADDADEQEAILAQALLETQAREAMDKGKSSLDKTPVREAADLGSSFLDEVQNRAYSAMENTNNNFFITGKAGTGKSFLLTLFTTASKKKTLRVSPTGISALNIGGATIHSAFGFYNLVNLNVEDININNIRLKSEKQLILKHVETIIIDEISMVRADTFDKIDKILKVINNNNRPFGGKQIIAFGDLFQLPPIAKRDEEQYLREKYGGIFFFFSNAYKDGDFKFIELTNNHRQEKDARFFEVLNRMREGRITDEDIALVNERVCVNGDELRRVVRLFPRKQEAEQVNALELERIPAREYTNEARVMLNKYNNQNINIDNTFPITKTLKLKLGALIMMIENDAGKRWVNGTLGIISFISNETIKVKINDIEHEVHKSVFETREATYIGGRIEYEVVLQVEQYPIVLAYAITIHKSQGMTYQRIACDISDCFAPGQAYVALSRCSSLNGISLLNSITRAEVAVDSEVKNFYINAERF